MRNTFANPDFEALTDLWNDFYPARYAIDPDILRLNSVQSPVFDWGASSIWTEAGEVCGFVAVKKAASSLYSGPDQDCAHISAIVFKDPRIGVDMLADVKLALRNRGISKLVFGQDSRHFFPGCPTDAKSLQSFLMVEGFIEGGLANDLERDLANFVNPYPAVAGSIMRYVEPDDHAALAEFMEREFPKRWNYDIDHKVRMEAPTPTVYGLFFGDRIDGFALVQQSTARVPIGGAVWRKSMGPNWGSLGPIGISQSLRGQGAGGALLGAALEQLRSEGIRNCIIDWTGLVDFYSKFGFKVSREYRSMSLNLDTAQGVK